MIIYSFYTHNILYYNKDSGDVIFSCNAIVILSIDFNNVNLDDPSYNENNNETIIHVRLLVRHSKVEKRRALEKKFNKELILVTWYPKRCWNFCLLEDEKKETEPIFTE